MAMNDQPPKGPEEEASGLEAERNRMAEAEEGGEPAETAAPSDGGAHDEGGSRSGRTGVVWKIATAALAVLLIAALIKPPFGARDEAVATVNGVAIGKEQLYDKLVELGGAQTLDGLIAEEVIRQAIEEAGVTYTAEEVDAELADIKQYYGSDEEFDAVLAQYGMTADDLRSQVERQVQIAKIVEPDVEVTDEQIEQYFNDYKSSFDEPEQVRASHILVAERAQAEQLLQQIQGGADFAELAKEHSQDTSNSEQGGDLNFFARGTMEQGFEDKAFELAVGELGIAETSYGFHVIEVTDRKEAHEATLDEKREEIRDQLTDQQVIELSNNWIADVQEKAEIVNTLAEPAGEADSVGDAAEE